MIESGDCRHGMVLLMTCNFISIAVWEHCHC